MNEMIAEREVWVDCLVVLYGPGMERRSVDGSSQECYNSRRDCDEGVSCHGSVPSSVSLR